MCLIETDLILAVASPRDKNHETSLKALRILKPLLLSPYSLAELDLLISSGRIKVVLPDFYSSQESLIAYYNINISLPRPTHMDKALALRTQHHLFYFDSLHAAVAISAEATLVSFDKKYSSVKELRYLHPSKLQEIPKSS
ncbi:PIN domain-containing protein [Thermofilum sp.]|uniref:type II toxin-antitoxin system VapC family toxin n=1 Tax=Thermofilum sp. TaxID=1961369 RepID=UPI00317672A6